MKIGDYVRTKYGIAKYIDDEVKRLKIIVIDREIAYDHDDNWRNVLTQDEIIISSSSVIDLIDIGDYVNGKCLDEDELKWYKKYPEYIGSIVTKEQFKEMKYNLKGDK